MAADASSAEDSSDDDSDLNYAHTAIRHRKHLDDSDLGVCVQLPDTGSTAQATLQHRGKNA